MAIKQTNLTNGKVLSPWSKMWFFKEQSMANTATSSTAKQMLDDDPMLAVDATGSEKKEKIISNH